MADNKIMVERELFQMKNKSYFSYFIKGVVRGKEIRVQIVPPNKDTDRGGYAVLDVVFGNEMQAELVVVPYEMKDESGKVIKGNTYMVRSYDEDGTVYECPIKPAKKSDKSFLNMLLR